MASAGRQKFTSMAHAVERGKTAGLGRLTKGIPNMMKLLGVVKKNAQGVPVWFLVLKGAWESAGVATTVSKSKHDVGLFQIIIKPGEKIAGYSWAQFKDPGINTKVFAGRVNAWRDSLMKLHGKWFPEGRDSDSMWGVVWLFGAIGSHATRHILNSIGPGANTFERIVQLALKKPGWFAEQKQVTGFNGKSHWGRQDPTLVVFRILVGKRVVATGIGMRDKIEDLAGKAKASAPFLGLGVGAWGMIAAATILILWAKGRKRAKARTGAGKKGMSGADPMESPTGLTYAGRPLQGPDDLGSDDLPPIEEGAEALGIVDGGSMDHFDDSLEFDIDEEALASGMECPAWLPPEVCRDIERAKEYMRREKKSFVKLKCGKDLDGKMRCIRAIAV